MSRTIHGKEQVDGSVALAFPIGLVKPLVAVFGATPDLVLDAAVNVVLRVGFDDEEACVGCRQVELRRVVVVLALELVQNGVSGCCWRRHHHRHGGRHHTLGTKTLTEHQILDIINVNHNM